MTNQIQIVKNAQAELVSSNPKLKFDRGWLEDFFNSDSAIDVKSNSKKSYRSAILQFFRYLDANSIGGGSVTRSAIMNFREDLKSQGKRATTIQNYIAALKVFFDWLATRGLYPNITHKVKSEVPSKAFKKNALTVEESRKLLDSIDTSTAAGKRNIAMIALMMICGLRTIEVSRANVGSISRRGDVPVLYIQGKGRNDDSDFVRLPKLVEKFINDYLAARSNLQADDPLFVSTSNRSINQRLSTVSISTIAKTAMTNAGIIGDKYTAHSLRHTAATNAIRAGASLEEVSQMLRHKSLNMTMIYNHAIKAEENPSERLVAEAIERAAANARTETASDLDDSESKARIRTSKKSKSKKKHGSSARNDIKDGGNTISMRSLIHALQSEGYRLI